ncbi:endonuclease domain-containing protein [Mycobacterium sp. MYCO198283]|uniref:DUF559 domain-containing protein n=1 Tax=Mycobacterium sp. MYCO198283 TaxID=2883505 RepID=UPI001E413264|nr:DUF559 domain-containing protein [Mycobacterium sp. MYCO198283]MCG5433220.1 endonuclease domain-containing protein [Mycobacterium sp. MYCO198283]
MQVGTGRDVAATPVTALPTHRVVRLTGATGEQLRLALDPLPRDAPVMLSYRADRAGSAAAVVDAVLDHLELVARTLFPAWLPGGEAPASASDHDRRVVRELARRRAADTPHFGPYLADLAEAALTGRADAATFPPDVRVRGAARVIADAYRRDAVVLLVDMPACPDEPAAAAGFEWLAAHGVGSWLTGDALPTVDRLPTLVVQLPAHLAAASPAADDGPVAVTLPPPVGRPHPGSAVEQLLERCLARRAWAVGRTWNQVVDAQPLRPPIRVDLLWPAERCVVELDGPDHRTALKYADDRRRDTTLVVGGYVVLRFTNDDVVDDPWRVAAMIEQVLTRLRT